MDGLFALGVAGDLADVEGEGNCGYLFGGEVRLEFYRCLPGILSGSCSDSVFFTICSKISIINSRKNIINSNIVSL